jgi:hypothetical protein
MDDNRVLSGARQQHLMSQRLDQAFHSFIHWIIILIIMIQIIDLLSYILYLFLGAH